MTGAVIKLNYPIRPGDNITVGYTHLPTNTMKQLKSLLKY